MRGTSPAGTEWAYGSLIDYNKLNYQSWENWHGKNPRSSINRDAVLHLVEENIYIGIKFTGWGGSGTGSFSYTRTTPTTLAVKLKDFSATRIKQNALLNWITASELQNDHFEILHSLNGSEFSVIAQLKGNGTTAAEQLYSYSHDNIASGKHFYQLVDVDKSGHKNYSHIISLNSVAGPRLQLFPNPATSAISISSSSLLSGTQFTITSTTGQILMTGRFERQQIDVQKLSAGQYWLIIKTNDGELLKTGFIKN